MNEPLNGAPIPEAYELRDARPGCFGYLCDDCAVSENCADFTAAFAPRIMTAQTLEVAGAFSPRCDF